MANPFQRYQSGGFEAVPGITQAGANIGQMLGSGFGNFGANIASGLKQYYENTAKAKAADEDIAVVGQQLMSRQKAYMEAAGVDPALLQRYLNDDMVEENGDRETFASLEQNPMVRYAKQLQPVLDSLKSSPSKGLSAKLSALNSAKASFGMIDEQMKLDEFIGKHRLQQVVNDLPDSVQVTEDVATPNVVVDPNNPFFAGVRNLKKQLEKQYPDNPEFVAKGVQDYIEKVKGKYNDQDMTPEQKEEFGTALGAYAEGLRTEVGNLTDYGEEDAYVQDIVAKSYAEGQKALKASEGKSGGKPQSPEVQALIKKRDERLKYAAGFDDPKNVEKDPALRKEQERMRDKAKADANALDVQLRNLGVGVNVPEGLQKVAEAAAKERKAPLEMKERLNILGSEILSEVSDKHLGRIAAGEKVTGWEILVDITGQDIERNPTSRTVPAAGDDYGFGGPSKLPEEYTPARKLMEDAMKKLGINPRKQLTADQFLRVKEAAMAGIQTQKDTAVKTAEEAAKITPESVAKAATEAAQKATTPAPTTPAVKSKPFTIGQLELGSRLADVQLNAVEKEAAAREYYSKRFGSVPTGFTDMYRHLFPEATVRMTEVNGVPVMVDGKGNITVLKGDAPSTKEIAESKALTFQNMEIADGVILDGIFAGTVAGAQDFRKNYSHMANVRSAIDELIKINDMGYESMSPTARARADQLQSVIIAALRIPIVGPGAISEKEQEILQRIVEKGTGIFTLEASERAALKGLKARVDAEIVNWPKSMGLNVRVGGQESDVIKQIRRRRLRAERNLPNSD